MKINHLPSFATFFILFTLLGFSQTLQAQTRSWVSGVGDDANPGSRTAPCKTWAGAISKTSASGEIDSLDSGGFGAVTITKAITLDGNGVMAGITAAGTPCITVNAGASDVVTLRNLTLDGNTAGTYGIRIISAGAVRIEHCVIFSTTTNGIDFSPTSAGTTLYVINSHIHSCTGAGVSATPSAIGTRVIIDGSKIENCGIGINSVGTGNVVVSDTTIAGNSGAGLLTSSGGTITTFHNNRIFANNPDGNPTASLPLR